MRALYGLYALAGALFKSSLLSIYCFVCVFIVVLNHFSFFFFFSSRRRHTRCSRDWSSDECSSDLIASQIPQEDKALAHSKRSCPARGRSCFRALGRGARGRQGQVHAPAGV